MTAATVEDRWLNNLGLRQYNEHMVSNSDLCPKCGSARLKKWVDLTRDEQILAEHLPASAEYTHEERKKHRFCTRCWYEEVEIATDLA